MGENSEVVHSCMVVTLRTPTDRGERANFADHNALP
jgi:hypothetical protein